MVLVHLHGVAAHVTGRDARFTLLTAGLGCGTVTTLRVASHQTTAFFLCAHHVTLFLDNPRRHFSLKATLLSPSLLGRQNLCHQLFIDSHSVVWVRKHVSIGGHPRISPLQKALTLHRVLVIAHQSLLAVKAFLHELQTIAGLRQVTRHRKHPITVASHVVQRQRMVQFTVVD